MGCWATKKIIFFLNSKMSSKKAKERVFVFHFHGYQCRNFGATQRKSITQRDHNDVYILPTDTACKSSTITNMATNR